MADANQSQQTNSGTNWAPHVKVSYGIVAGAITTVVLSFVNVDPAKAATLGPAITTIVTVLLQYGLQYLIPEPK